MTVAKHDPAAARDSFDVAGRPGRERYPARNASPAHPAASHTRFGVPLSFPGPSRVCRPLPLHTPFLSHPTHASTPGRAGARHRRSISGAARRARQADDSAGRLRKARPRKNASQNQGSCGPVNGVIRASRSPDLHSHHRRCRVLYMMIWIQQGDFGFGTWPSLIGTVRRACLLPADERTSLLPASLAVGHGRPSDDTKCSSWKACGNPSGIRPTLRDPPP